MTQGDELFEKTFKKTRECHEANNKIRIYLIFKDNDNKLDEFLNKWICT